MGTVTHYTSEQPLLSSACKSGQRVTMATRAHVPCETSLGQGVELGLLQTLVGFMSLGQQLLRRHLESLDPEETQSERRHVKTPAWCVKGAAFGGMKSGMGFSQGLQIKSGKSNLLCHRFCTEACD